MADCPLCLVPQSPVLWQNEDCRVVLIEDADYPAYCRVEWLAHVKEMTDLQPVMRAKLMKVVLAVETALRELLNPEKVNLASLGNMTPHLHWHVIPRFKHDKHFPNSHWGEAVRSSSPEALSEVQQLKLAERIQALVSCALTA